MTCQMSSHRGMSTLAHRIAYLPPTSKDISAAYDHCYLHNSDHRTNIPHQQVICRSRNNNESQLRNHVRHLTIAQHTITTTTIPYHPIPPPILPYPTRPQHTLPHHTYPYHTNGPLTPRQVYPHTTHTIHLLLDHDTTI